MRIGILGGTFNPIHNAHIALAEAAREQLGLDRVLLIPTYMPPHKKEPLMVDASLRYEMVKRAIAGRERLEASDIEIQRQGTSYSVETVQRLKQQFGRDADFFFIIGSDSLKELPQWRNSAALLTMAHFAVATRPGFPVENVPDGIDFLEMPAMDISSTEIRSRIKEGRSIEGIVPDTVCSYIEEKGLYR